MVLPAPVKVSSTSQSRTIWGQSHHLALPSSSSDVLIFDLSFESIEMPLLYLNSLCVARKQAKLGQSHHHVLKLIISSSSIRSLSSTQAPPKNGCYWVLDFGFVFFHELTSSSSSCKVGLSEDKATILRCLLPPRQFYLYARSSKIHLNLFTSKMLDFHQFSQFSKYTPP